MVDEVVVGEHEGGGGRREVHYKSYMALLASGTLTFILKMGSHGRVLTSFK